MKLNKAETIVGDEILSLPNGVAVLSNGDLVVADGGNDRVCLFDRNGTLLNQVGGKGYGKYRMKEPVGVFANDNDKIFVADWHNHRVVVYDKDLNYVTELGYYSRVTPTDCLDLLSVFKQYIYFIHNLSSTGVYTKSYFGQKDSGRVNETDVIDRIKVTMQSSSYWFLYKNNSIYSAFKKIAFGNQRMDKPNGVAFDNESIYISQKNKKCIDRYIKWKKSYELIGKINEVNDDNCFGRLANIEYLSEENKLFVCDEQKGTIRILDNEGKYISEISGKDLNLDSFYPFSCCHVGNNLLSVAGSEYIYIIEMNDKIIIDELKLGEPHAIDYYDRNKELYIANRRDSTIESIVLDGVN